MNVAKRLLKIGLVSCLAVIPLVLLWQYQAIEDWWNLRNYVPPPAIASLATADTMNDKGRRLFYVNKPQLDDKQVFNNDCTDSEQTIVLGCYKSNSGIYILTVTEPRLKGVEEVTAAHEMLHAAYDRLSAGERKHIDDLTNQVYSNIKDDRLRATVEQYRQKDPSVVPNELHSILGTEVKDLPPELEAYYSRYFSSRQAIVAMSEQYEQEFTSRKNQINQFDSKLATLKKQIDSYQQSLAAQNQALNAQRGHLDGLQSSNTPPADYNAQVAKFNSSVVSYNAQVVQLRDLIKQYNDLVSQRNAVASEQRSLVQAIDSRVSTQATQ